MRDSLVTLVGVGKLYEPSVRVLSDIDWSVAPGERCVVLGSSGSGKSTLLSILAFSSDQVKEVQVEGENCLDGPEKKTAAWHRWVMSARPSS